ncbi:hypothetical protein [Streptomyces sp. SID14515]|uniref:hypothetical protein n=1 Tax=Streptomyces sp. SID14515 TaxID=2706074 RepID=UPI001EF22184|nr:hypothetical protein [Streptomyces sp. SID14515]
MDDYRQALFGWYAVIQHAHACVMRAALWFADAQLSDPRRPEAFTDWMTGAGRRHSNSAVQETEPATQGALREIILMMRAWSPHTFEAMDVAFQKAGGEDASHAWGGGFEPAGRHEARAAAEALASVLSPEERQQVREVIDGIERDDEDRDMDLAKDSMLACTSDGTAPTASTPLSARTAPRPEAACTRKPPGPGAGVSTARPTLPGWPGSCSDP